MIMELEKLRGSIRAVESVAFLKEAQDYDMDMARRLMIMVTEEHLRVHEKLLFVTKLKAL